MFKIYGVTDPKKTTKSPTTDHHGHDDNHEHTDHENDHTTHETDIGQIAVDILDTTSSIIIIAPIA